ncbi:hypothetical protein VTN31DRAFT_7159 [Thermomyces dupontii]|uniref:uncharacterized protein n=1 Tax=Talaromyces thermophilus TaxID=28565 RepID=UPI00374308A9
MSDLGQFQSKWNARGDAVKAWLTYPLLAFYDAPKAIFGHRALWTACDRALSRPRLPASLLKPLIIYRLSVEMTIFPVFFSFASINLSIESVRD